MAAYTVTLPAFFNTDADFRTWGSEISARLGSGGLVKTSDTGQINWTTVAKPASPTYQGYEIWRFADALQSSVPVFIKVEYGSGGATARPAIRISVGSATDGAGTFVGAKTTSQAVDSGSSKTAGAVLPVYISVATDRMMILGQYDGSDLNFPWMFLVERAKDSSGNNTSDGVVHATQGSLATFQTLPFYGAVATQSTGSAYPTVHYTSMGTDSIFAVPVFSFGQPRWLSGVAIVDDSAVTVLSTITASPLGVATTYLPVNLGVSAQGRPPVGVGTLRTCVRYE